MTSSTVLVPNFDEPLGVLLNLVEQNRITISTLSVSMVTETYMKQLNMLNVTNDHTPISNSINSDRLADLFKLGARLTYIKSLSLLPRTGILEQKVELERLNNDLSEYKKYQQAAAMLVDELKNPTWPRQAKNPAISRSTQTDFSVQQLSKAYSIAIRNIAKEHHGHTKDLGVTQAEMSANIIQHVTAKPVIFLEELTKNISSQFTLIVLFLSILELIKTSQITVEQPTQFGSLSIRAFHA